MSVFILENISKTFRVDKVEHEVLKDINLAFPNKGLCSIIGKSGSGKSTLLNILMGIEKPTAGKVFFKGRNIRKYSDKKFSSYHLNDISIVFQHYNLFDNLTAFENISLPLKMRGFKKRKIKENVNRIMTDLHIEKLSNQKCKKLSGGEKQRVAIARAIITNPAVILCDEPTGALDPQNSREIMDILKEKSKNLLVLLVSHNLDLVRKYSDFIVELKDGKIVKNTIEQQSQNFSKKPNKKRKYSNCWSSTFLCKNLKKNLFKNVFSFLSCCLGFTAMLLCVGFTNGSSKSQNEALMKNLSIGYSTISSVEELKLQDSPLTYQKMVRPKLSDCDEIFANFNNLVVGENLSYLISSFPSAVFNEIESTEFQVVPLYDFTLESFGKDMLVAGSGGTDNFEDIIVNEEFIKLFKNLKVNDEIIFKNSSSVIFNTYDEDNPFITDTLNIEKHMKIIGIIKEFPFLNSPKIYYSYKGAVSFLKRQIMENLSFYKGKTISFFNYLEDANSDDSITSYSLVVFLTNLDNKDEFFKLVQQRKGSSLEITSNAYEIKDTYEMFISSFSKTLVVFAGIAFVGINLIIGMISLSTFIENRKNTAILTCLGSRNSSIYKIYLIENYLLIGFALICSLFLSFYLQDLINPLISEKFALSNLIIIPFESLFGIRYFLIFLLSIFSVLFSTIFSIVPMSIYRNGFVTEELRDE